MLWSGLPRPWSHLSAISRRRFIPFQHVPAVPFSLMPQARVMTIWADRHVVSMSTTAQTRPTCLGGVPVQHDIVVHCNTGRYMAIYSLMFHSLPFHLEPNPPVVSSHYTSLLVHSCLCNFFNGCSSKATHSWHLPNPQSATQTACYASNSRRFRKLGCHLSWGSRHLAWMGFRCVSRERLPDAGRDVVSLIGSKPAASTRFTGTTVNSSTWDQPIIAHSTMLCCCAL